ncbi:hypothetical protein AJ80_00353 [Polytolypa hystricis UAMH7299]|uniref:Uncharacterized protein n=1 Tax=Polytolypa hystricis (strain UAMH7299) TaxID=1447883 RepID=A0A2B7Z3B2_POLH7|nr:hypothetical protein AJ80_00353 [Polytolypa hystricis UAMH7299]
MIRRLRSTTGHPPALELAQLLHPVQVFCWGPLALNYLGVPVVAITIVVSDDQYQQSIERLTTAGFLISSPRRNPAPEVLQRLPDPEAVIHEINDGYKHIDQSTTTFNYPDDPEEAKRQVTLIPSSVAHLSIPLNLHLSKFPGYDRHELNLFFPLEPQLLESFIKSVIDDDDRQEHGTVSLWGGMLRTWIAHMRGYLEIDNDAVDGCADKRVTEWFSVHFGRKHEAEFGPWDLRVSKRLGSSGEMGVDMRGNPVNSER